jgi:integrase
MLGEDPKLDDAHARELARHQRDAELAAARSRLTCEMRLAAYQDVLAGRALRSRHHKLEIARIRSLLAQNGLAALPPEAISHGLIELALTAAPPKSRWAHFGALDRFLRWCLRGTDKLPATAGFDRHEKPKPPEARERVLRLDELATIWRAAEALWSPLATDLIQFLITTPCRRGEASAARWRDIDLTARTWSQPISKNGQSHLFALNERAMAILTRRRKASGGRPEDHVFHGAQTGTPFTVWSFLLRRLHAALPELRDWRLHDFRRSFASTLADAGVDETLLDLCLNHRASRTRGGVLGIYQRSTRWSERVAALDTWNDAIECAIGGNVTPLRKRG